VENDALLLGFVVVCGHRLKIVLYIKLICSIVLVGLRYVDLILGLR